MKRLAQDYTKDTQYLTAILDFIYFNIWFAGREGLKFRKVRHYSLMWRMIEFKRKLVPVILIC